MKRLLWYLIAGTRGGSSRAQIINLLHEQPYNANQLTEMTGMDYKTVRHHLKVLEENDVIAPFKKKKYGTIFFLTTRMENNYSVFQEIWKQIGKK
jgi:predicted transcriptional regulator